MSPATGAPRPRALVHGLTDEEIELVRSIAGSVEVAENLGDAHPEEHDVLIFVEAQFHMLERTYPRRLAFAPEVDDEEFQIFGSSGFGGSTVRTYTNMTTQHRPARDFDITADTRDLGLVGLVERSCKPADRSKYTGFRTPVYPERKTRPLLQESLESPLALAAILEHHTIEDAVIDSAIWLPDIARSAFRDWVLFAFEYWRAGDPDRFPVSAEWMKEDRWSSIQEKAVREEIAEFERIEAGRLQAIEQERQALTATLDSAEVDGAVWRAILTKTGDELVAAVGATFEFLGFSVQDADDLLENKAAKREDLRVSEGDWTALVEVKGYGGAAKSNDLGQVTRAAVIYAMNERKEPDALWYVPNPERGTAPSSRGVALAGREDDLNAFADNHHGSLIDTRDLFALRQRVANRTTSPEDAREELKSAAGRYSA